MRAIQRNRTLFAAVVLAMLAAPAAAMTIKSKVQVEGPYLRLADVLIQPGNAGETIVAEAPDPGETDRVSYYEIDKAAREAGLAPGDLGRGYVEVRREGRTVPDSLLEKRIRTALSRRGIEGPMELRLTGLRESIYVPIEADPQAVDIARLRHDERSGRLNVTLEIPGDGGGTRQIEFSGVAEAQTRVPVLREEMAPGETISADDVTWSVLSSRRVNRTLLVSKEAVIGKEPVRPLRADRPLRESDLRRPRLVEKGDVVTMVVRKGQLTVTAMGKAMENGAKGDTVRLVNTDSNRSVDAVVTGHDRVRVVTVASLAEARAR